MITRAGALLLSAALLAGCGSSPSAQPSPSPSTAISTGGPATTAGNRAAALAESRRILSVLSPPNGGEVLTTSPSPELRDQLEGLSPSDTRLSQHAWWTVPMPTADFARWLRSQHLAGMTARDGGSSSAPDGVMVDIVDLDGTGTSAYSAPTVTFAYVPHGGGTAVRLDTFIAARYARSTFVPADVTQVAIRRTTRTVAQRPGQHPQHQVRRTTTTDPATVRRLLAAANHLDGIVTVPNIFHCPMILTVKTYVVTFTAPSGTWTVTGPSPVCGAVLTLRHDGKRVPPALDPGRTWFPLVEGALAQG